MTRHFIIFWLIFCVTGVAHSQNKANMNGNGLTFSTLSHDFGSISRGKPVTHVFELKNTGKLPLTVDNVQASCGCTTPEWNGEPIAPGASTGIRVGFNAATEGAFSKTITVSYNGNQVKTLTISGEVYASPATSAPLNASLSIIKQINQ